MYCKHCGKEVAEDSKFCKHCGSNINTINIEEQKDQDPMKLGDLNSDENQKKTSDSSKGGNRLGMIFFWSLIISVVCTLGYAVIRNEDSKPHDSSSHYWGSSVYDPNIMSGGDVESVYEQINWIRKDKYEEGIKKTAIYSFPIAFGILVIGAILTGNMNKK